jgi:septum formation topological specificity factor MinE
VITLNVRSTNGKQKKRRFRKSELIEVLFDFVETNEEIEFENSQRHFDLQVLYPKLSLEEKKHKTFGEVFGDSELE